MFLKGKSGMGEKEMYIIFYSISIGEYEKCCFRDLIKVYEIVEEEVIYFSLGIGRGVIMR